MSLTKLVGKGGSYLRTFNVTQRVASGVAIGAGATINYDLDVSDFDNLTLLVSQTGAANGDLAVSVLPFETDGATPFALPLTPTPAASGPTYDGSANVNYLGQFDLRGVQAVRVAVKNNNAAAKSINFVDVFAATTGSGAY